jgi:hypothetical protein
MRNSIFLHSAVLFLAALSPALVGAQFQQPTPEELKMTSDPKAPGAAAVYLDYREMDNGPSQFRSFYVRIKVLTEKGKEAATISEPFLKGGTAIREIHGRTIHPDGTVIPLTVKPEDLLAIKIHGLQVNQSVFTLPSVEVGSILEYSYVIDYDLNFLGPPKWEVQKKYFVHRAHFEYTPLWGVLYWSRLPKDAAVKSATLGGYKLDISDIPPIPDEKWMPPIESLVYEVIFHDPVPSTHNGPLSNIEFPGDPGDLADFWRAAAKEWSKGVTEFAEPSKAIKAAVDDLIAPNDSDLDKAKKLYVAVQALDNTDFSRQKTETERKKLKLKEERRAEDTWKQKSGSSEDIAMLYLTMLRAAGLTAYAAKVVDRDKGIFDLGDMSLDQFDSTLVVLGSGGQQILLDPGEKMCPFQTVNWRHSAAMGLRQGPQGDSLVATPAQQYQANSTTRVGDLYLAADGGITGTITIVMIGQEAMRWRQTALENDVTGLKKEFDRELETMVPDGVEAHVDHFLAIDQPDQNLMAIVKVEGSLATATGKRLLVPGYFLEARGHIPFVNEEKRLEPVDMHYGNRVTEQMTYHLPAGMTVEGAPPDTSIPWPGHAEFVAKSSTQPGQITLTQVLSRAFTFVKPDEYPDLRGFYQKVAAADQAQLVLTIAPAGKSN